MMTTTRSFSLGRRGEAQWERLRAAYILSQRSGEIVLVASDSQDVRDEIRRRLEAMAPRVEVIAPSEGVTLAIHELAKSRKEGEKLPVAWIEAPPSSPSPESDMRWIEALVVLNQTRDALRMHGPCHVVLAGPKALHRVVATRAPDLTSFMAIMLLLDDTLEELVAQQGTLTWLHLSDLHVQSESWQQDHVLGSLVRDLPRLLDDRELRPDLLFVTGDVAARGLRTEYDGAVRVLDELAKQLGLDRRQQVFVVPGNHDVDRNKIGGMARRDHASLLELSGKELRDAVGELLGDAKEFRLYGERLEEWCAFSETLLGRARSVSVDRPWRSDVIDVRGLPVGVLSLCTAWASGPDDRKGSLILGERQIHDMVAEARDGGAQLVIALMHHPLHWLHDGEHSAIRGRLERDTDVVLHGHVHDAHVALHLAARSAHVEIGAGAAYAGLDEDRYHGFSVGRLDVAEGRLDVHCFTWSTQSGRWHPAAGVPGADDNGRASFVFSPAAIAPEASRRGGHEVLATRLRHAAATVYATVDFAGLRAGGPRRHVTLEQIFVPLHLTAKGLDSAEPSWFEGGIEEETVLERGGPAENAPEDEPEAFRGRADSPEASVVDAFTRVSGRVTLAGLEAMLAAGRKVVALGGPGSGKSTLSRYLASTIAAREGGTVPILLTVRDWIAEGKREHLLDMAVRQAGVSLSVRTDREALEALCGRGRVVLIVDGVDEAADASVRRELRDQVHGFVAAFPDVPVLVTSRIAGYHDVPLDDRVFDELTLEPFDDEAIEQFVRRWYDLVEDDPAVRLRKRVDLLHALDVEPRAKELARNPLLATLIGMVHFSHAQLPGDRAKLYGLMVELLLITWPAERKRELPELHGTVQQPMLEKLALRLQEQRAPKTSIQLLFQRQVDVLLDVDTLESILADLLAENEPERGAAELRHLARRWGKWLVEGSGILQEQQPGRVAFLHLSLMEYMAGRALLERSLSSGYEAVASIVKEKYLDASWRETLLLMLGSESKSRGLSMVVVERLLEGAGELGDWKPCEFGLALLREEVDMGDVRERLLAITCDVILTTELGEWEPEFPLFTDLVHLSRNHGESIRKWLRSEITAGVGERWVAALILALVALSEVEVTTWVEAREDRATTVLALLDFGSGHALGRWARWHCTRDLALAWARSTPIEGILLRSFGAVQAGSGAEWIPSLFVRSAWEAQISFAAAERTQAQEIVKGHRGLPARVVWLVGEEVQCASHLCPTWYSHDDGRDVPPRFAKVLTRSAAGNTMTGVATYIIASAVDGFVTNSARVFGTNVAHKFAKPFAMEISVNDSDYFSADTATHFEADAAAVLMRFFEMDFSRLTKADHAVDEFIGKLYIIANRDLVTPTPATLWDPFRTASTVEEAFQAAAKLFVAFVAEAHAALVLAHMHGRRDISSTLVTARIHNRWLNLFFTPLVEYATRTRPLPEHPDLHALLLTYGLIQYQTTWEWPDCPHWRSWFADDPPEHWLPAHVWHLVRSIQDPQNPTHREQADAALARNDWPELAQALRETTLVPTPPEVLALFDHGNGDLPTPPQ